MRRRLERCESTPNLHDDRMEDQWLTREDFLQSWVTPADALALFDQCGVRMGMERLVRKLHLGIGGLAVCEHAVRLYPSPRQDFPLCHVHAGAFAPAEIPDSFWVTGDLDRMLEITSKNEPSATDSGLQAALRIAASSYERWTYVGVRFPPATVQSILPTNKVVAVSRLSEPTTAEGDQKPVELRPVSQQELKNWARDFLSTAEHGLTYSSIEAEAVIHFAGRKITRDPLRAAIKSANYPVKRGNPSIRGKSTRE